MIITLACPCGKKFRAKSEHAGKKMKCSACGKALIIPRPKTPAGAVDLGNLEGFTQPTSAPLRFPSPNRPPAGGQRAKKNLVSPILAYSVGGGILAIGLLSFFVFTFLPSSDSTLGEANAGEVAEDSSSGVDRGKVIAGKTEPPVTAATGSPVLPGAVKHAPAFLLTDAPFDVAKFFESPPADQNAAPLYLDALFEFSTDVSVCFTEQEQQKRRPIADARSIAGSGHFDFPGNPKRHGLWIESKKTKTFSFALRCGRSSKDHAEKKCLTRIV